MRIRKAGLEDLDGIMRVMHETVASIAHPEWFVPDDETFIRQQLLSEGFTLAAEEERAGEIVAFLVIRLPGRTEDNLGIYLLEHLRNLQNQGPAAPHGAHGGAPEVLSRVAHFESVCVLPEYRGNGLQRRLFEEAERILSEKPYENLTWYMGTVHPDNQASLKSFLHRGFRVLDTVEKYGGLKRLIVCKQAGSAPGKGKVREHDQENVPHM